MFIQFTQLIPVYSSVFYDFSGFLVSAGFCPWMVFSRLFLLELVSQSWPQEKIQSYEDAQVSEGTGRMGNILLLLLLLLLLLDTDPSLQSSAKSLAKKTSRGIRESVSNATSFGACLAGRVQPFWHATANDKPDSQLPGGVSRGVATECCVATQGGKHQACFGWLLLRWVIDRVAIRLVTSRE